MSSPIAVVGAAGPTWDKRHSSRLVTIPVGERATEGEAVNVATLDEPRLDGWFDDGAGQLAGALRIASRALASAALAEGAAEASERLWSRGAVTA
jgi:hypothetical protein